MPTIFVQGYNLNDFSGPLSTLSSDTTPNNFINTSTTYSGDGNKTIIEVDDDDPNFEDAYLETGGTQTLAKDITVNGTTYTAGASIELEFSLTTNDSPPITFYIIRIGTGASNSGENVFVATDAPLTPGQTYTFGSGADGQTTPYETICFAKDTQIETPRGPVAIQDLQVDSFVLNSNGDRLRVKWVGSSPVSRSMMKASPNLCPVRIKKGAFGKDKPNTDLVVSQQHRVLLSDWRAEVLFDSPTYLTAAKNLVNDDNILIETPEEGVEYYHVMFDQHEILISNGLETESFHPGKTALKALDGPTRQELFRLFPELKEHDNDREALPFPDLSKKDVQMISSSKSRKL